MEGAELSLDVIKDLGGIKEDLELLKGVDQESVSDLEFGEDSLLDTRDVKENEIKAFIKSIGLRKGHTPLIEPEEAKAVVVEPEDKEGKKKKRKKKKSAQLQSGEGKSCSPNVEQKLMQLCFKQYRRLLIRPSQESWFEQSNSEMNTQKISAATLSHLTSVGAELMRTEVALYEKVREKNKGSGDVRWLRTVLSSGTLSDKVAALTLLVQESPPHSLLSLDSLLTMASKKCKRESLIAADTLKQLWLTDLLPENRKLKSLKQRPLSSLAEMSDLTCQTKLLLWYFEDQLKARFAKFLGIIKVLSHDHVADIRERMLGHIFDLLYRKPEQERELLLQLVNKLGDPAKRVASKAGFFLLKLVTQHVNMKIIVAKEMEGLLHRPNIAPRAQYYAVCTLNQFTFVPNDDEALAAMLMEMYFTFFKVYAAKRSLDTKMLAALLTGVNRAFPFVKEIPSFEEHLHSLFKVVHVGPLATGIQSLMLLYQVMESHQAVSGRYYQALYSKLLDPQLKHSGKQAIFLNLLFKSLKSDPELKRVKAFLKRILQVCAYHTPPFVCGCLFLISEVLKVRPNLWSYVLEPPEEEEHFADVSEESSGAELEEREGEEENRKKKHGPRRSECVYQISGRNPLYCRAESCCLWELARLKAHYHPSVQAFSNKLSAGDYIQYHGDPLEDFSLMRFLDRFVIKNPKQHSSDHGGSLMQRTSRLVNANLKEMAVNSSQFAALEESKVREDERFMHKYFVQKALREQRRRGKEQEEGDSKEMEEDTEGRADMEDTEMDFAGELERQKRLTALSRKGRKKKRDESEGEDSEGEEEEGGSDFSEEEEIMSGEGMMDAGEEEIWSDGESLLGEGGGDNEDGGGGGDTTEAEMERLLLDNMSSSEPEEDEAVPTSKKRKRKNLDQCESTFDPTSMFAAAEEFAHLLEGSDMVDSKEMRYRDSFGARTRGRNNRRSRQQSGGRQLKNHGGNNKVSGGKTRGGNTKVSGKTHRGGKVSGKTRGGGKAHRGRRTHGSNKMTLKKPSRRH